MKELKANFKERRALEANTDTHSHTECLAVIMAIKKLLPRAHREAIEDGSDQHNGARTEILQAFVQYQGAIANQLGDGVAHTLKTSMTQGLNGDAKQLTVELN